MGKSKRGKRDLKRNSKRNKNKRGSKNKKNIESPAAIAKARIDILFTEAMDAASAGRLDDADRYVQLAWKIKLKFQLPLKREYSRLFCRRCGRFLVDGKTGLYRTKNGFLKIKCLNCGTIKRIRLK